MYTGNWGFNILFMFAGMGIVAVAALWMDEIKTITPSNAKLYTK